MKILVCDDRSSVSVEIADQVRAACPDAEVGTLSGGAPDSVEPTLESELESLFARVERYIPPSRNTTSCDASSFDGIDLVLLDNNLSYLNINGARLTAESIAGYIRTFTTACYVVSLNKSPDVDFDLRYLVGDRLTRADLALNTDHLSNGTLWGTAAPKDGFAPWYWPVLADAVARRREQIAFVEKHFDDAALAALGFADDVDDSLSRRALGRFQAEEKEDARAVTFRDLFMTSTHSIPDRGDRRELAASVDRGIGDVSMLARVVAADLDLWFRSDVISAQDVLVDATHLVARMPFLLAADAAKPDAYDRTATANAKACGFSAEVYEKHLAAARYQHEMWSPRPTFWWDRLKEDDELAALWSGADEWVDVVFCEDLSRFAARVGSEGPREFVADIESAFERRYAAALRDRKYVPASRFALP